MILKVVKPGGVDIMGRRFPQNYTVEADSYAEAFARSQRGMLRRRRKVISKVEALLAALASSGKVTIETE